MNARGRESFTLIEMLVVIVVIAILAGLVFKMVSYATRRALIADCVSDLEEISHALNEFRAEYGQYPPVSFVAYEYENTNRQNQFMQDYLDDPANDTSAGVTPLFRFGLVSYLWPRYKDWNGNPRPIKHTNNVQWVGDLLRDWDAKQRWKPFLEGVDLDGGEPSYLVPQGGGERYTNATLTVDDPWDRQLRYVCPPPYLSYKLWSVGPDGQDATHDDIHREKWDN